MRAGLQMMWMVLAAAGCSYQANFDGQFACEDTSECPAGLTCSGGRCQANGASDGGGEGVDDGGEAAFSCATLDPPPAFCADFDQGGPIGQGWEISYDCIVADTDVFLSPPRAAAASVTTASESCALRTTVTADQSVRLAVDVRMDPLAPQAINVVRIDWRAEVYFFRLTDAGAFLAEGTDAIVTIGTLSGETSAGEGLIRYDNAVVYVE